MAPTENGKREKRGNQIHPYQPSAQCLNELCLRIWAEDIHVRDGSTYSHLCDVKEQNCDDDDDNNKTVFP